MKWYARPVFFVADLERAVRFYVDQLGFVKKWHEGDGTGTVCQVNRGGCEIILCEDRSRSDRGRVFVSLTPDGYGDLTARGLDADEVWWGYDCLRVLDPDGNELLFPRPT